MKFYFNNVKNRVDLLIFEMSTYQTECIINYRSKKNTLIKYIVKKLKKKKVIHIV